MVTPAFEIVQVEQDAQHTWRVHGRALQEIQVGATVGVDRDPQGETSQGSFVVQAISTYGRDVEALYPVLTGTLTLVGQAGDTLAADEHLWLSM